MFQIGKYEEIGHKIFLKYPDFQKKYKSLSDKFQISFLLGMIDSFEFQNKCHIKNVLELGVFNGITSLYMLKTGCKRDDFQLYGIEIGKEGFFGEAVFKEATEEELLHYHLHRNSTSFDIEKVVANNKIDMVFIDAGHSHPHPIIDLIHVLPFLHEESIVLLHDVVDYMRPNAWGESFIYCGWKDEKYQTVFLDEKNQPIRKSTLGCIKIPKDKTKLYDNIMDIIMIPFRAAPWKFDDFYLGINENHLDLLKVFMEKYYNNDFAKKVIIQLQMNLCEYKKNWLLYMHETKFYNFLHERLSRSIEYDNLYTLKIIQKIENLLKKVVRKFIKKKRKNIIYQ